MGLTNAPIIFSMVMYEILGQYEFVIVYFDDICIYAKTVKEHIEHLKLVIEKFKEVNLKINPEKSQWISTKIKLLGYVISSDGIEMDPSAIKNRKPPTNVKTLQQFLGMCNYYRKFIRNFADITTPLYNLLKKETKWNWSEQCENAFKELIGRLTSEPVLKQPDPEKPYVLHTDASNEAVGAILSQVDDENREYVIAYASRTFRGYEKHMEISEKEMAASVYGVLEFKHYLIGTRFKKVTDHCALQYLMTLKDPTGKLARWSIFLSQFDFEIVYRKGKIHANADYVSRPILLTEIENPEEGTSSRNLDPYEDGHLYYYITHRKHKEGSSRKQVNRINKVASSYELRDGKIFTNRKGIWLEIPKPEERLDIIDKYHAMSAHFGVDSTVSRIKEKFYWAKLYKEVEKYKRNCKTCIRNDNHLIYNHPAFANKITNINDEISIDFSWGLNNEGTMLVQEECAKRVEISRIATKTADEIATNIIDYFCTYGPSKRIRSDCEPALLSETMEKVKAAMGVEWHKTVSAYSPSHNGLIEKFVGTFGNAIRKLAEKDHTKWFEWIPFIKLATTQEYTRLQRRHRTS